MACIEARNLRKVYGKTVALDGLDMRVEEGRILGLIGPNGAGKTTALNAILGLTPYEGELRVLGHDPWTLRDQVMRDVSFIADVAVLPRWLKVSQALDYVAGVHPRFDRVKAEGFLAKTDIKRTSKAGNCRRDGGPAPPLPSWPSTRGCWCLTSRRSAWTFCIASSSTTPAERLLRSQPHHRVTTHQVEEIQTS